MLLVPFLFFSLCSCTFFPSFSSSPPDLLIAQDPPNRPLFVNHPPPVSPESLWFSGHARKAPTSSAALTKALSEAFDQFSQALAKDGYLLTPSEKETWFRLGSDNEAPSIADRWIRTYKETQDRPYLHRTSLYILLKVPRSYEQSLLGELSRADRRAAFRMESEREKARMFLLQKDGSRFLDALRKALKADRSIHSLHSFSPSTRRKILHERTSVESLWRKSLRALRLSLDPSSTELSLGETTRPPTRLTERASIRIGPHPPGLSGLVFIASLRPSPKPEHLVFPEPSWLFGNRRPILSPTTLRWEAALFRQPTYRLRPPLELSCQPTGTGGTGECTLSRVYVPGHHGFLEGFYRPVPGTPLDRPHFRKILKNTLLDVHFRFYHRRALHPLLLTIDGPGPLQQEQAIRTFFMTEGRKQDLTLCTLVKGALSCPGAPPAFLLSGNRAFLRIDLLSLKESFRTGRDFSIATTRMTLMETLVDRGDILWRKKVSISSRGFSRKRATLSAWHKCARDIARNLAKAYYPSRRPHPGETFYDR